DPKSININIDGSCFSVHHIYITYGAPACTTCLFILNLSKNSHLCLFPFFPEMFCKDKAFISNYQKIIELFLKLFCFIYVLQIILSVLNLPLLLSGCKSS
ncbi:hypothetical protein, partial [Phocaeicola vulgatus]|uniref:hypothetical protein n=2 Tax=Phocaeicola vulgatus TaxID=821 RepID=UPI0035693ADC